jgi:zinc transporter ZupT
MLQHPEICCYFLLVGASFSSPLGKNGNFKVAAFFSILFHEIPHELGDFSILIESGFRY